MARAVKLLGLICIIFLGATLARAAEDANKVSSKIDVTVGVDFYSQYIWRGQQLTDGWVLQPSVTAKKEGLSGTVWGNIDMENCNDSKHECTEVDWTVDYSGQLCELLGYSVGAIHYDFPNTTFEDTTELYWGLNLALPLNPTLRVYHDVDEAKGTYVSLGAGHSFGKILKLSEDIQVGMDVGAIVGWGNASYNDAYWSVDESAMNDLLLKVSFPIELPGGWRFAASVNYSEILSQRIRDEHGGDEDHLFTGLSLAKSF